MAVPARQLRARQSAGSARPAQRRPPVRALAPRPRKTRRSDHRKRTVAVLCVLLTMGSLLAVTGAHAYLTQGQVRLTRLQNQLSSQLTRHRNLELQVANLEQPSSVLSEAQKQGLVVPTNVNDLPQANLSAPTSGTASGGRPPVASTPGAKVSARNSATSSGGSQSASRSGGR